MTDPRLKRPARSEDEPADEDALRLKNSADGAADPRDQHLAGALSPLVRSEAHRMVSQAAIQPDPERVAAGWERRFIAEGPRAEEMIQLYRELGYEVVADPVRAEDLAGECESCQLVALLRFKSIYTRRPAAEAVAKPVDGPPRELTPAEGDPK